MHATRCNTTLMLAAIMAWPHAVAASRAGSSVQVDGAVSRVVGSARVDGKASRVVGPAPIVDPAPIVGPALVVGAGLDGSPRPGGAAIPRGQEATARGQEQALERISMAEALRLFGRNSLALRAARAEAGEVEGIARQTRAYPNPALTYVREQLGHDGEDYSESIVGIEQRLEWPGRTVARGRAAGRQAEAARAAFRADSIRLAFEVRKAYVAAWAGEARETAIRNAADRIGTAADAAQRRFDEGDISGFEVRRLRLERIRVERDLAEATVAAATARRTLSRLVLPESGGQLGPAVPLTGSPPEIAVETALGALATRPDLEAAARSLEAARARESAASTGWVPDPTLAIGYKEQADGFSGAALGVTLPIPLFDRRGGAGEAAGARVAAARASRTLREREARDDVLDALDRHASTRGRLDRVGAELLAESDALMVAAAAAYDEGEMTLLELLDAAGASRDARLTALALRADAWIAYYDLLRAMARAPEGEG